MEKWSGKYAKLCDWVEANIEETLTFLSLPRQHHKHMKSTNMLERLMEEIKRRTWVVRIFPNPASCLRLVRALAAEIHDGWIEADRYLDMKLLAQAARSKPTAFQAVSFQRAFTTKGRWQSIGKGHMRSMPSSIT